ncbi:MAG: ferritin-like domain-containing protein, partial [Halobacteriales archaeon]
LENAFYRDGLETFADDELMAADALSVFGEEVRMQVPSHLKRVGNHEAAHVSALTTTIENLNGTPVMEGEYEFGYSTPSEFLGVAKALENTGVAAYAGAAPTVSNDDVFAAAIGIHSVEARHASFLNALNGTSPFPDGVDTPKTMAEVTEIAGQFIVEEEAPSTPESETAYWQVDFGEGENPPDPPSYWPDDVMAAIGNSDEGVMGHPSAWRQGNDGQLKDVTIINNSFSFDSTDDPTSVTVEFEIDEGAPTRDLHIASFVLPGPYKHSEIDQQELHEVSSGTFEGGETGQLTVSVP